MLNSEQKDKLKLIVESIDDKLTKEGYIFTARHFDVVMDGMEQLLKQCDVSCALLSDVDYWKQRCLLAEQCLEKSPCDPDITADQIKAWNAYYKFISWAGNDR